MSGTVDITLPEGTASGDLVFVVVGGDGGSDGSNNRPTTSGYTALTDITDGNPSSWAGYKVMGETPDTVVTISGTAATSGSTASVSVFRGVDTVSPVSVASATAGATSGAPNPPSRTLTAGQMSVCWGVTEDDVVSDVTAPTDWGNLVWRHDGTVNACQTTMIASRLISSDGAYDPGSFATGVTDDWDAGHFALAPAA